MSAPATQVDPHRREWTRAEYDRLAELGYFAGQNAEFADGDILIRDAAGTHSRRWTKDEYYRMADEGFLQGQKAELLGGDVMVTSPQNWPHYATLDKVADALRAALGAGFWVRTQAPLALGLVTDPEPDVSAVPGKRTDYTDHPPTASLVVEVSETTLAYDRGDKASLYAKGGITDYWIVNLVHGQLEVYRDPGPDATQPHGHGYATVVAMKPPASVSPLCAAGVSIPVADLLP
jgi:Uma2 family endonuclease